MKEPSTTTVQLIEGDCLTSIPELTPQSVNMMFADLPYGVTRNAWDISIDLQCFWSALRRVMVEQAWSCLTADMRLSSQLLASNFKEFRHDLVWQKKGRLSGFLDAKRAPLREHEHILMFARRRGVYNPQMREGTPHSRHLYTSPHANGGNYGAFKQKVAENKGTRFPTSIVPFQRVTGKQNHPTEKPVALLEWLIRTYTNDGDTILDPVAGSGTTAIAAINVGNRNTICIEKDPVYFAAMSKRVEAHQAGLSATAR